MGGGGAVIHGFWDGHCLDYLFLFSYPLKWRAILLDVHKAASFGITLYKLLCSWVECLGTGTNRSVPAVITRRWICSHIGLLGYADNIVGHLCNQTTPKFIHNPSKNPYFSSLITIPFEHIIPNPINISVPSIYLVAF